jgi:hypothetical protein
MCLREVKDEVRAFDGLSRPGHSFAFNLVFAVANPGGIHQAEWDAAKIDDFLDDVACGAGRALTIARSAPSSRFRSDDFPTFGAP